MNILVLAGGYSPERNVSLSSGAMIAGALRGKGHNVALIDSYLGVSAAEADMEQLFQKEICEDWKAISTAVPDLQALKKAHPECKNRLVGPNVLRLAREADVVFLALHGGSGEDGRIQAALDLMGVHYTGSDYLGSGIAMNKHLTKILAKEAGVAVPDWEIRDIMDEEAIEAAMCEVKLPIVVKVPGGGSSIGVYIAKTPAELRSALECSLGQRMIFEQYIEGREIQMGFLDGKALPSIEIVVNKEFYNYENKYQKGLAIEKTPADILPSQEKEMGEMLLLVANALSLRVYSRADFIIDKAGKIWFIEINTLPGMTPTSLLPQEAEAVGVTFGDLCEKIISEALKESVGTEDKILIEKKAE
ncbi:MAG: D-alanine--D-alanine ligase [Lachnospiraceae bacterium]|nr:D-alanine--D-alanine ligase [Lachnospiraceae bacterium]